MWDVSAPFVRAWIRDELGPESAIADRIKEDTDTLLRIPALIRRLEEQYPPKGGAPDLPPLPDIELILDPKRRLRGDTRSNWPGYLLSGLVGAGAVTAAMVLGVIG